MLKGNFGGEGEIVVELGWGLLLTWWSREGAIEVDKRWLLVVVIGM